MAEIGDVFGDLAELAVVGELVGDDFQIEAMPLTPGWISGNSGESGSRVSGEPLVESTHQADSLRRSAMAEKAFMRASGSGDEADELFFQKDADHLIEFLVGLGKLRLRKTLSITR